ncbi:MAG: helix-turn-helix domain-containing protein [Hyphomonadaceae bacterium JAD_PAG50586_4]|nr:MAG: helix-turn-helix domain-containing protein [Hyphomonadaceae bacterium JAD_PAG50586_4]
MAKANKKQAKAKPAAKTRPVGPRTAGSVDAKIGALIRERRLAIGVSQMRLAEALGITFQQIQKYEKGVNRVAASTLMRVARTLECKVTDLLPDEA